MKDFRGYQGKKGKTYLAWQLPNSYGGGHQQRPKGRQKRINRRLTFTRVVSEWVDPPSGSGMLAQACPESAVIVKGQFSAHLNLKKDMLN